MDNKLIFFQKLGIFAAIFLGSIIILKILDRLIFNRYFLKKLNIRIPALYRDILIFIILAIVILVTLRIEFGFKLTGIITSSAILSAIIGLALQDTLSNIISGIVLHIEKPFKIGDWIKVGEKEGEIVEVSWRATRLRTLDGNYIVIPNTNISKETILNYYEPERAHAITFHIGIEYGAAPNFIKEILLKSIEDCHNVLKEPKPVIHVIDFGDHAIQYELKIWIDDHSIYKDIKDDVMSKLWYSLKRHNIEIPFPIRTVYFKKKEGGRGTDIPETIKRIELLNDIPEEDILQISESTKIKHYTRGERIIIEGEEGYSLYIILQGQVNIISRNVLIRELKEGEYFGEMSLLTGEKRSATAVAKSEVTVLEIHSSSILPVIKKNPSLMETLSNKLAERKIMTKDIVDKALISEKLKEKEALSKNIFNRIKEFFSIR